MQKYNVLSIVGNCLNSNNLFLRVNKYIYNVNLQWANITGMLEINKRAPLKQMTSRMKPRHPKGVNDHM